MDGMHSGATGSYQKDLDFYSAPPHGAAEVDPGETDNLYDAGPGNWAARLESKRAQSRAKKVEAAAQIELDDAQREKLEALGYVN